MKFKFNKKTIFIILFSILYLAVGLVSTIHAVQFFGLANSPVLGTILAVTFEIGQAAVLFNLLTNPSQRKKFMPWALMIILTAVQILGNIFSSYKYLITNSNDNLRFFKEPIFMWTDLPDNEANVIITYIVGAILPIVALCLTEMVVSYLGSEKENEEQLKQEQLKQEQPKPIDDVQNNTKTKSITNEQPEVVEEIKPKTIEIPVSEDTKQAVDELLNGNIEQSVSPKQTKSHFINM
jgi:hypothetical protein